jgi:hypothetical protein
VAPEPIWPPAEAVRDLAVIDALLGGLVGASAAERREATAGYFDARYGERGPRVFALFARLCGYLARHADELRDRGLLDLANGGTIDPRFLEALLGRLETGLEPTVAEVPARDVPDDAVEP